MAVLFAVLLALDLAIAATKVPYQFGSFLLMPVLYGIVGAIAGARAPLKFSYRTAALLLLVPPLCRAIGFVFINNAGLKDPSAAFGTTIWFYFYGVPTVLYLAVLFAVLSIRAGLK